MLVIRVAISGISTGVKLIDAVVRGPDVLSKACYEDKPIFAIHLYSRTDFLPILHPLFSLGTCRGCCLFESSTEGKVASKDDTPQAGGRAVPCPLRLPFSGTPWPMLGCCHPPRARVHSVGLQILHRISPHCFTPRACAKFLQSVDGSLFTWRVYGGDEGIGGQRADSCCRSWTISKSWADDEEANRAVDWRRAGVPAAAVF